MARPSPALVLTGATQRRSFATAAWLGWQIESNWADPWLFAIYAIAKPLAIAGILVVMYATIARGDFASPVFTYIYLGNAFYIYVGAVMTGMTYAIVDDRERYRTLASMYVAPVDIRWYLAGRGVARFLTASASVLITLAAGVAVLHVRLDPLAVRWPMFLASLGMGIVMLAMLGLLMAGVMLLMAHHAWSLGEAVPAALFLFSGAIFPLDVLPAALRPIGFAMPVTYWLEAIRRSLAPQVAAAFPTLSGVSDAALLGILFGLTAAFGVMSLAIFAWCDTAARERGLIDRTSNY